MSRRSFCNNCWLHDRRLLLNSRYTTAVRPRRDRRPVNWSISSIWLIWSVRFISLVRFNKTDKTDNGPSINTPSKLALLSPLRSHPTAPLSGRRAVGSFPIAPVERAQVHRARSGSRESSNGPTPSLPAVGSALPTPLWPTSLPETRRPAIETDGPHRLAQ